MRFYELNLYDPGATKPSRTWTTHPNGILDPGALSLEFDMFVTPYATPIGSSTITLHGVALQDLMQTQQFGLHLDSAGKLQPGMTLELLGGMKAGLPLANPAQIGTLIFGEIYQCFGTWRQTNMKLDFTVLGSPYTNSNPGNFILNWKRGQKLSDALQACLSTAYPGRTIKINISDRVVADEDMPHACSTLEELARALKETTEGNYVSASYPGVDLVIQGGIITAYDGTVKPTIVQLSFTDLVGQPVWVALNTISVTTVLRGDIRIGDIITMPESMLNGPGSVSTTADALPSSSNYQLTFQGKFMVKKIRHIGSSRSPDGTLWITVFECIPYREEDAG